MEPWSLELGDNEPIHETDSATVSITSISDSLSRDKPFRKSPR